MDEFRVCLSAGPNERALFSVEYQQILIMRLSTIKYSVNIQQTQHVNRIYGRVSYRRVESVCGLAKTLTHDDRIGTAII